MFEQVDCDLTDPWTVCVDLYFVGDQEPMMLSISLEAWAGFAICVLGALAYDIVYWLEGW